MANEAFLTKTYKARDRYASSLGAIDPNVLAPLVNPTFMDGPAWPDLRQAWRVIRAGKNTIIMSDGLSDPFADDDEPNVGFGLEVLAESADRMPDQLQTSWLFSLAYQVSQQCAAHGGVRDLIDELKLISLELPAAGALQSVAADTGRAGVLLGMSAPGRDAHLKLPGGRVAIVTAKLLWPSELQYAASRGDTGRAELARWFAKDGTHHRSP